MAKTSDGRYLLPPSERETRRAVCPDGAVKHVAYGVPVASSGVDDGDDVYVAWDPQGEIAVFATETAALRWATPDAVEWVKHGEKITL